MLSTTNTESLSIELSFTNQNSKPPEIEDNINMTLIGRHYRNETLNRTKKQKTC